MQRSFLETLSALWRRERRAAADQLAAERRTLTLSERIARGIALRDLAVDETDAAPGGRTLLWLTGPADLEGVRLGPGDVVRLWWDDPDGPDAIRAIVTRRRAQRLAVMVDGDLPDRFEEGGFRLDRDAPEVTFDRGDRAIARFREAPARSDLARMRAVLTGAEPPEFEAERPLDALDGALDEPQRLAVVRALAARDVALIHGPPGTGKTRTLVEVVRQAVRRGDRVLATAASNTATDNLAERLAVAGVPLVRLGHPARVSPAMEPYSLDAQTEASGEAALVRSWVTEANAIRRRVDARSRRGRMERDERRALLAEAGRLNRDARHHLQGVQAAIVSRARVVCATAAGADGALLGADAFDLVVLDEATQAPDPIALVALGRGRRAVLAGDPHQLPPTVIDPEAQREGLGTTFFERLASARGDDVCRMLVVQHRMHEAIMAFPSASRYDGRLVAAPEVATHRLEALDGVAADPLRDAPFLFLDTAGRGWEERRGGGDPSTSNPGLADRVAAEVRRLLGRGVAPADLAVISPYDAQVRLLRDRLGPELRSGVEIGTVDGFQGREKEAVVVDLVRCNDGGDIGFLADTRRMNVALTRARRFLLVAGDSATLGGHSYYAAFLGHAEASGAWLSAWTDEAPPFGEP